MGERKGSPPPGGDGEGTVPDPIAPRSATTDAVRERLIDEAYRMITADGAGAVTVRRLAAAAGVSTMAVYTRFGSVGAVTGAVCERGFDEFADLMESVSRSDDPVADLQLLGLTYLAFATAHPHLYTLMFQYTSPDWDAARRSDLMSAGRPTDSPAGRRAFAAMMRALERVGGADARGDAGGVGAATPAEHLLQAGETWSAVHGLAMLSIAGHLRGAHDAVAESLLVTLAVGHGADRVAAQASLAAAQRRLAATEAAISPGDRAPSGT
ncbi:TetR family transcriptional regulator [Gordonia iterans]|uniref:TetR family transcriptional regulator n=1 Tax=Gordonia iterans TaxID=1004901 RepID=A0A2S0KIB5_9ACTN|nr:TetR/AcrR family transcriptional regulator [Gordonia iterans]AVM01419.1 TetR family transcriptional regulator [Gordonia iterans]